jgi:DNA-binding PadR family transcriptional regulator
MAEAVKKEIPMRSPVNWAVLGLVIDRPSYAFELWNRFEELWGDVLPVANSSSIYFALGELRKRGLVERVKGPRTAARGQPKPHERATREGLEAYEEWVVAQMRAHVRLGLLFARRLGIFAEQPEIALGILERLERACLDDRGARIPTPVEFPARVVPGLGDRLASVYGRSAKAGTLAWIASARREFEVLADGEGSS